MTSKELMNETELVIAMAHVLQEDKIMDFDKLPADEPSRKIALVAKRNVLKGLIDKFKYDLSVSGYVTGTIYNEIEFIDKCLEFGVDHVKAELYEHDAKLDNQSSEQFNHG